MEIGLDWLTRIRTLVPEEDRKVLLSPARLVRRFTQFAAARHAGRAGRAHVDDLGARDPELVALLLELTEWLGRYYFRLVVRGVDRVPASGPVLLVGNHNGGLLPTDAFFTALALRDRFGEARIPYALVHDFLLEDPLLRRYALRLGMLRAGGESARHALGEGRVVLVYPGSDYDAFRPFTARHRIVLGGRRGFLRLALEQGVPIVPVVSAGTHEQMIVLSRGDGLARRVHAHAWARTEVLPLVFALPWGITSGFVPYLPLPAQTTVEFGEPIQWPALSSADVSREGVLARCYAEVESRMQGMLDDLYRGRRFLLGQRVSSRAPGCAARESGAHVPRATPSSSLRSG